jgi:hypothetical protein
MAARRRGAGAAAGQRSSVGFAAIRLRDVLELQDQLNAPQALAGNLGDAYLLRENPFYRRVRVAALGAGFRFSTRDPGAYFAFPLTALDTVLASRRIPYRDNVRALRHLEDSRPGFFALRDLALNRPTPNYLLHEAAHAVAFERLFGRPRDVRATLAAKSALLGIELGEAFAMTSEYFAAVAVRGNLHRFFFSINSYRTRVPMKRPLGELVPELGLECVVGSVLLAFLWNLFLRERLAPADTARLLSQVRALLAGPAGRGGGGEPGRVLVGRLGRALNGLMRMDLDFRTNTTRLFLGMFGRGRNVRRVLAEDPLELLRHDPSAASAVAHLVRILSDDDPRIP